MSCPALIIAPLPDGRVQAATVQWDGFPLGVGRLLLDHYPALEDARAIVALGGICELGRRIAPIGRHEWCVPEPGTTLAFHRDGGEALLEITGGSVEAIADMHPAIRNVYAYDGDRWTHNGQELEVVMALLDSIEDGL